MMARLALLCALVAAPPTAAASAACPSAAGGEAADDVSLLAARPAKGGRARAEEGSIYVVRHAERDGDYSCLNATGWTRAGNLSSGLFLNGSRPKRIFAYNYNDEVICERCLQTAVPLATALQLDVNHSYPRPGKNCLPPDCPHPLHADEESAEAMLAALAETDGGPIVAFWESLNTKSLLKFLGVGADAPWWPYGSCELEYNRMYQVNYKKPGDQWEYSSLELLTEGMPCLVQRLGYTCEAAGGDWPPASY